MQERSRKQTSDSRFLFKSISNWFWFQTAKDHKKKNKCWETVRKPHSPNTFCLCLIISQIRKAASLLNLERFILIPGVDNNCPLWLLLGSERLRRGLRVFPRTSSLRAQLYFMITSDTKIILLSTGQIQRRSRESIIFNYTDCLLPCDLSQLIMPKHMDKGSPGMKQVRLQWFWKQHTAACLDRMVSFAGILSMYIGIEKGCRCFWNARQSFLLVFGHMCPLSFWDEI